MLSEIAAQVYTVERLGQLADKSRGDTEPTSATTMFASCVATAPGGGLSTARMMPLTWRQPAQSNLSLKAQLKIGGRLVIPVAEGTTSLPGTVPGHARFEKMSTAARISRTSASFH